jgi:hypothetical protein
MKSEEDAENNPQSSIAAIMQSFFIKYSPFQYERQGFKTVDKILHNV